MPIAGKAGEAEDSRIFWDEFSPEGRGFVNLEKVYGGFLDIFDNEPEINITIYHLLRRQLIQLNTRSLESMKSATHIRISSAGWYYFKYLVRAFAYLDLVFQDTPINDQNIGIKLGQLITEVDEISEIKEYMSERMDLRFERVETFLSYLSKEEQNERKKFSLNMDAGPLGQEFIPDIFSQYQNEKEWIQRRIAEKAFRRTDDTLVLDQKVPDFVEGKKLEQEGGEEES